MRTASLPWPIPGINKLKTFIKIFIGVSFSTCNDHIGPIKLDNSNIASGAMKYLLLCTYLNDIAAKNPVRSIDAVKPAANAA